MTKPKRIVTSDNVEQVIKELLDLPFWPPGINTDEIYRAQTDDTDGKPEYGWLMVQFSCDGDAWVSQSATERGMPDDIRFRMPCGGGRHLRVRNAICILAMAMKLDMEGQGNPSYDSYEDEEDWEEG